MSEANLDQEAGRLEGMAAMVDAGHFDRRKLSHELRAMAERLVGDRKQARAALAAATAVRAEEYRWPG